MVKKTVPKKKMKIVKDKDVKKYDTVHIITANEKTYEYDMRDWDMIRDDEHDEWIDFVKRDGSEQHSYNVIAIATISYSKDIGIKKNGGGLTVVGGESA
jgi:hypothetical protein